MQGMGGRYRPALYNGERDPLERVCCCAWTHAALDAARGLMHRHNILVEEIAHIRVEAFHETFRLGTELPTSTEEAQFNLAWPLAVLLLDHEVGPARFWRSA